MSPLKEPKIKAYEVGKLKKREVIKRFHCNNTSLPLLQRFQFFMVKRRQEPGKVRSLSNIYESLVFFSIDKIS
jgi:hypothetical protein